MKLLTKIYGTKLSRKQPEVNLRLTKKMREEGIYLTKMNNFLSGMGVKCRNNHTIKENEGSHQEFF